MFVRRIVTLCSVSLVALGLIATPAAADDCFPYYRAVNGKYSHSYEKWGYGPGWRAQAYGPGVLKLNRTVETSNSFNSVAGITVNGVSSAVGFDVTRSESHSAEFEAPVPDRGPWILELGTVEEVFVFDIQQHDGCAGIALRITGQSTAERSGNVIFRYYRAP